MLCNMITDSHIHVTMKRTEMHIAPIFKTILAFHVQISKEFLEIKRTQIACKIRFDSNYSNFASDYIYYFWRFEVEFDQMLSIEDMQQCVLVIQAFGDLDFQLRR